MWNSKKIVEELKHKIDKILNRFSNHNLNEFKDLNAEKFNAVINMEFDDPTQLEHAVGVHAKVSHVSSFTQVIAMTILAEENLGWFLKIRV